MQTKISNTPTPWAVYCQSYGCPRWKGQVFLTHEEYQRQLSDPLDGWRCPECGDLAEWDAYSFNRHFDEHLDEHCDGE